MASPIGHALAGIAVAWGADFIGPAKAGHYVQSGGLARGYRRAGGGLMVACALLAAAPDLDLLLIRFHRTATHSVTSVVFVALVSGIVAAWMQMPVVRVAAVCAAAWTSHMLLDWLSADQSTPRGFQFLWPFDATWFISGWDVFPGTERRRLLSGPSIARNATAVVYELAWMLPIVVALWALRQRHLKPEV
jgi:membrane-bound metal-dependent hydrolase YbcI (DUF457 family)